MPERACLGRSGEWRSPRGTPLQCEELLQLVSGPKNGEPTRLAGRAVRVSRHLLASKDPQCRRAAPGRFRLGMQCAPTLVHRSRSCSGGSMAETIGAVVRVGQTVCERVSRLLVLQPTSRHSGIPRGAQWAVNDAAVQLVWQVARRGARVQRAVCHIQARAVRAMVGQRYASSAKTKLPALLILPCRACVLRMSQSPCFPRWLHHPAAT